MVVLITNGFNIKGIEPLGRKIMGSHPAVKSVVQCNNPAPGNVVLGRAFRTLAGSPEITETVHGLSFTISPGSFFQVNTGQLAGLMDTVLEMAKLCGNENILDAFCGVGLFSLLLANRTSGVVTGIESEKEAVKSAVRNAAGNNVGNVAFAAGRVETAVRDLPAFDVAVLDPPRKGCDQVFLKGLAEKRPGKIIYVSCNPATLARDLKFLTGTGYALLTVQPIDMFPQTAHVESVVSLQRI
jgi:23S rRNA (uracil1939-C5)-methyltransferase